MDDLSLFLSVCIGCVIAWLVALYADDSASLLLWNTAFGMAGAALCAVVLGRYAPEHNIVGLLVAGPICALLTIAVGHAIKRMVVAKLMRPRA